MRVVLSRSAQDLGVSHPAACFIRNIRIRPTNIADEGRACDLDAKVTALMERVASGNLRLQDTPQAAGFRELFTNMGYPDQVPAGERLLNQFTKHGFKRCNNIVDAYNLVSIEYVAWLGVHDAGEMEGSELRVCRSDGTDRITPMFKNKAAKVKKGDLVYGIAASPLRVVAWLGKKDVDSDDWKVTSETSDLFLIVLGNRNTSEDENQRICAQVFENIRGSCPDASIEMLVIEKEE